MTGTGTVLENRGAGLSRVRVPRRSACGRDCASCGGCGAPQDMIDVAAKNLIGAPPGSRVIIESSSGDTLKWAALVYLAPIALFFAGWALHPAAGGAGALAGFGLVFWAGRRLQKRGGVEVRIVALAGERDG